ncbi:hypothetical protein SAMN05444722_0441 [Rhodovulum sp. ES.010]|uniref:hypothetical protein n=1 Tax=Rhodovulum sp. ES.010 TaxID=1882821 RepID=UPI00092C6C9D|nr:hypothetical protein [Rhodovulum sp. ES.010]SIO10687.1 hypothetical protein SAMN05444722_0441 [Rhodovulum sp. ES.010]
MATITAPEAGEAAARAVLEEAEEHFRRTIRALYEIIDEVEAGKTERARALRGALIDLGKAAQTAFDERLRVEKRLREEAGTTRDYALDLDAARVEVGSRLGRLRTTRGPDGLSK